MFRRKDELDIDGGVNDMQGSLLGEESETVSVLHRKRQQSTRQKNKMHRRALLLLQRLIRERVSARHQHLVRPRDQSRSNLAKQNSHLHQSHYRQQTSAQTSPVSSPVSSPVASNSNSNYRPTTQESGRFRPAQEASKPLSVSTTPTSTFNNESNTMLSNKPNQNERVLTVGNDILLKGEITACDRLIIEGKVDATVSEVHTMELASAGSFRGNAEVEYAEISGVFEGNLIVRTSLVIHQTGKVSGSISYGEIEIARGGSLTGEIKAISAAAPSNKKKEQKEAA